MQLVSFDIYRTLGLPNTTSIKSEKFLNHRDSLLNCDWVLFPEYWQLNVLLYALGCQIFPSQASYLIGHNKTEMLRTFAACEPRHTPHTLVKANGEENRHAIWQEMDLPFVAKLTKSSMGEGVWLIECLSDWQNYCQKTDVLYVQEYLPIDRDLRIVIIGSRIVDAYWRLQANKGFYNNVAQGGVVDRSTPIPAAAMEVALKVATKLGINYAGFDIAMVGRHPYLLEFNRLFGTRGILGGQAVLNQHVWNYLLAQLEPPKPTQPPVQKNIKRVA